MNLETINLLALLWVGIIGFGIIMYVILDGYDLGIGILSIFFRQKRDRDIMISTILPVWDGNETWLVFGAAALYCAFPLAFSIILPAIYIPIILMVLALLFRGVAFEFRFKAVKTRALWDYCFFGGSLVATLVQGLILGTFVQGFDMTKTNGQMLTMQAWFNPFSIFCAIALTFGYMLLGSNRLIEKTTGSLQNTCFYISEFTQYIILLSVICVSLWSPNLDPAIWQRWFNPKLMPFLAILPLLTLILLATHWWALKKRKEKLPFWCSIGIFVMCYLGFGISTFPYLVPRQITYTQAASNSSALLFMLIGTIIMMPPLLYYTYYSYKIFKGKVTEKIDY